MAKADEQRYGQFFQNMIKNNPAAAPQAPQNSAWEQLAQVEAQRQAEAAQIAQAMRGSVPPQPMNAPGMAQPAMQQAAAPAVDPSAQAELLARVAATGRALAEDQKKPAAKKPKLETYRQAPGAEQDGY